MRRLKHSLKRQRTTVCVALWVILVVILAFAWPDRLSADDKAGADLIISNDSAARLSVEIIHFTRPEILVKKFPKSGVKTKKWIGTIAANGATRVVARALRRGRNEIHVKPLNQFGNKKAKIFDVKIKLVGDKLTPLVKKIIVSNSDLGITAKEAREAEKKAPEFPTLEGTEPDLRRARRLAEELLQIHGAVYRQLGELRCDLKPHDVLGIRDSLETLRKEIEKARKSIPPDPELDQEVSRRRKSLLEESPNIVNTSGRLLDLKKEAIKASEAACAAEIYIQTAKIGKLVAKVRGYHDEAAGEFSRLQEAVSRAGAIHRELKDLYTSVKARQKSQSEKSASSSRAFHDRLDALKSSAQPVQTIVKRNTEIYKLVRQLATHAEDIFLKIKRALGPIRIYQIEDSKINITLVTSPDNMRFIRQDHKKLNVCLNGIAGNSYYAKTLPLADVEKILSAYGSESTLGGRGNQEFGKDSSAAHWLSGSMRDSEPHLEHLRRAKSDFKTIKEAVARAEQCLPPDKRTGETAAGDEPEKDDGTKDPDGGKTKVSEDEEAPPGPRGDAGKAEPADDGETRRAACDVLRPELDNAIALIDQGALGSADSKLKALDASGCPELGPKIAAEKTRISTLVEKLTNNAQASLDACAFKESRNLIKALPEGPRRAALVARWNEAYKTETKARVLATAGIALNKQGEPKRAIAKLHEAGNLDPCDSLVAKIDKAIGIIGSKVAEAEAAKGEEALSTCKFKESRQLIKDLPKGQRRFALVTKWNEAYKTEGKARALAREGMKFKDQGEPTKALEKLRDARKLDPCNDTVMTIDRTTIAIESQMDEAKQKDEIADKTANADGCGDGYYLGEPAGDGKVYCIPKKATADTWCEENSKGSGWIAGRIKADGTHDCHQNQAGRNAKCEELNPDRDVYAGKARSDGTFECYNTKKQERADVWKKCFGKYGSRAIRVYKRKGVWKCERRTGAARKPGGRKSGSGCPLGMSRVRGKCLQDHIADEAREMQKLLKPRSYCRLGQC